MTTYITVRAAYGREYRNQTDARKDWNGNLDFLTVDGHGYINKADADRLGVKVMLRYAADRKVMELTA
jgi:hypothetical protein